MASHWLRRLAPFLLLAISTVLCAQEFNFSVYRQTRGLDNLTVSGLAFDRNGFLWVGTENGLYRFYGDRFQRFGAAEGIEEREIQDVYTAPDGSVWVGTYGNLYRLEGGSFVPAGPRPIPIWNSQHIAAEAPGKLLVVDKNRLFRLIYAPDGKLVSYEPVFPTEVTKAVPASDHLAVVLSPGAPDGAIWVGCHYGVCSWKDGKLTQFTAADGLPKEFLYSLMRDRYGNLWGISGHHVVVLTPGAGRFIDRTPLGGDPNSYYRRAPIALDSEGRVLVSTAQGIARWNGSGWKIFGPANGLQSSYLTALAFDANGDLWMGSSGQGLYHWNGYADWEGWTVNQGMPSSGVWSVGAFDGNQAYLGTEKGPAQLDLLDGKIEKLFREPKWRYGQVSGMALYARGHLLAGTFSGAVLDINPTTRRVTQIGQLPDMVFNVVRDQDGRIFIASATGVFLVPAATGSRAGIQRIPAPLAVSEVRQSFGGHPPSVFNGCSDPSGATWFVTTDRVFGFRKGQWIFPRIDGLPKLLPQLDDITCAVDGSLWVTSQATGTRHLTWETDHWSATELPLPEENRKFEALAILSDRRGWIWIGTDNGLLAYNGRSWRHLTQESGLVWNDIDSSRLALGPDGSIWIGTSGGLGHLLHPEHIFDPLQLNVAITQVSRGSQTLPSVSGFALPWSNQSLEFQFAAPLTVNRGELRFRYRIPELNADWTTTAETDVQFHSLPPGEYTFELSASNPARAATSAIVTANFRILPPWWRSNWFYVAATLALLALLWLLYFLRTRHLLRMKRQLEIQVGERTLELEASREEMRIQATHDSLTGLLNRGAILEVLDNEMERALRDQTPLSIVLADVDLFKNVNDTWGHLAGDAVLRHFALSLRDSIRPYDSVGRYGGEEFLLILPGIATAEVEERLQQLHQGVSGIRVSYEDVEIRITCSMGAVFLAPATLREASISPDVALAAADLALYKAKQTGRNRVLFHSLPDRQLQPAPLV